MNCPYCNEEMVEGVIQSPQEISWQHKRHFFGKADFHKGSIVLSKLSFLRGSAVKAQCCRKCEKIVIDYGNNNCDLNKSVKRNR